MKVLITGGAGVLGSNLSMMMLKRGYDVTVMDIVRPEEAWRLEEIIDSLNYLWKSTLDISREDVKNFDIVIDCAIGSADRPFGTSSPEHSAYGNVFPALHLLEAVKKIQNRQNPVIIYPSSFNALYGHGSKAYNEDFLPNPISLYGWTKASTELLYMAYHKSYDIPVIITRTASAYGPKGRSDELPHKLIIYALKRNQKFYLRSPLATRLWTYAKDIMNFYDKLLDLLEKDPEVIYGKTLHCAGNKKNEIIKNVELANKIKHLTNSDMEIIMGEYEPGETIGGTPLTFNVDNSYTQSILRWKPSYTIDDGLKETIEWFKENLWRYNIVSGVDKNEQK